VDSSPFAPKSLADLTARLTLPSRLRRREIPFRYLLDTRLFRLLCDPGQGVAALEGFRASLARHRFVPEGCLPDLEMTPLGVFDALGIEPPPFPSFPIPKHMVESLSTVDVTILIAKMAKESFEKELPASTLQQRVDQMRQETDPAAHDLLDLCLTRFVSNETSVDLLLRHLAMDTVFRFRFPEEIRDSVAKLFNVCLLDNDAGVSALSKMRLIKMLWDRSFERILKKHPQARGEIQAVDQEIKPRAYQDFLAWEVIHHAVLGYPRERVQPVIAFAPDPASTLEARSRAYKTALRSFLDQIRPDELATIFKPRLEAWKPGWLVPCQPDGTFDSAVSTGELPIF
jgi:hypothetical protein